MLQLSFYCTFEVDVLCPLKRIHSENKFAGVISIVSSKQPISYFRKTMIYRKVFLLRKFFHSAKGLLKGPYIWFVPAYI